MSSRYVLGWVLAVGLSGCVDAVEVTRRFCDQDADCAAGLRCVVDLSQGASYCAGACSNDRDCPAHQRCQRGVPGKQVEEPLVAVCVDLVRSCEPLDRCNGLDDDCDGVVDGPDCALITPCLDDAPCGLFVCSAPLNFAAGVCVPPISPAPVADLDRCDADTDCRNGVCEMGRCSPLCRPLIGDVGGCAAPNVCAQSIGAGGRPAFNQCQERCTGPMDCADTGEACLWRAVVQGGGEHHSVCATPPSNRKPLGAFCAGRTPEIDDECISGLCFGNQCTRICGGPGSSCSDVAEDARCCMMQLQYGIEFEYFRYVCVPGETPCG